MRGRKDANTRCPEEVEPEEETQGVERNQVVAWYSTSHVKKVLFESAVVQANATEMMNEMKQNWPLDLSVETNLNLKCIFRKLCYLPLVSRTARFLYLSNYALVFNRNV